MFDIGFSEIVVVGVVALVVIGPEKLPKVARTLGHMFGRLQRYVGEVKADITREIELDELRKLQTEVKEAARDFEQSVSNVATEFKSSVREVETQLNAVASDVAATTPGTHAAPVDAAGAPDAGVHVVGGDVSGTAIASSAATSPADSAPAAMPPQILARVDDATGGSSASTDAGSAAHPNHAPARHETLHERHAEATASTSDTAASVRQPTLPGIERI